MAVVDVQFRSEALNHDVFYSLILPESGDAPYPVVFQLHGLGDSHRAWIDKSMLVMHVRHYPLAIVMPGTGTDAYLNWDSGDRLHQHRYEDLIMTDIRDHVRRHFNVTAGPWGIGGLSMGGYGAMRLGLKYPDVFASIWSHSSAFLIADRVAEGGFVGDALADASVYVQADRLRASSGPLPAISFDCGVDDELIEDNRKFDAYLTSIGLEHHYAEHPGAHTWDYWDFHVREALAQHARILGVQEVVPGSFT